MRVSQRRSAGFTLIELVVTVAVIVIVTLVALPSFQAQRQRAALRGAGDQVLSFWNQARLEALKRNSMVKVGFVQSDSGKTFCMGAAVTTDTADVTPCDCTQAAPGSNVCDVARFPANNSEWNSVSLSGLTLGGGADLNTIEPVVIEPKRLFLQVPADDGTVSLNGPTGSRAYKLNLSVDRMGRAYLCESTSATDRMSDYGVNSRRCAP